MDKTSECKGFKTNNVQIQELSLSDMQKINGILLGIQGRPENDMFTIKILLHERKIRIAISVPLVIVLHHLASLMIQNNVHWDRFFYLCQTFM